jgi:hypothetical protein
LSGYHTEKQEQHTAAKEKAQEKAAQSESASDANK